METWKIAGLAVAIETLLVVAAAFGGPHGTLGAWPWALQVPGILAVLYPPGGEQFIARVSVMATVQTLIWFLVLRTLTRRLRHSSRLSSSTP